MVNLDGIEKPLAKYDMEEETFKFTDTAHLVMPAVTTDYINTSYIYIIRDESVMNL